MTLAAAATMTMTKLDLVAASTFGLEAVVARELEALGYEPKIIQSGRVLFSGDESDICRANLWLRTADRVLLRMGSFEARDFGQLFDRTFALPWEAWIAADAAFPVSGRSIKSQLSSVPACQKIVKKAVVEKLKAAYGVEWFEETGAKYSIEVALLEDQATLTIDTSGPGLHKRGYRPLVGKAPLKETLAAALVLLSYWSPERPLVDPFCGSGTIPIEAALIGRNMAPGLAANFRGRVVAGDSRVVVGRGPAGGPASRPSPTCRSASSAPTWTKTHCSLPGFNAEKAGVAEDIHFQQTRLRRPDQQAILRLRDLQSALRRADGRPGGDPGPVPRHAQRLSPSEDMVVLRPHRASGFRGCAGPRGPPPAEALQRPHRMHLLPILRTEAGRRRRVSRLSRGAAATRKTGRRRHRSLLADRARRPRPSPPNEARLRPQAGLWRAVGKGPGAGRNLPQPTGEAGAAPPPLAHEDGHHLLPPLRARHSRSAAGGRSL